MSRQPSDLVAELEAAREAHSEAETAVQDVGESRVEAVADAYDRATDLLDRYEGSATGTGDFQAYVTFQNAFVELVESLDDDLPGYEAFEEANEQLDKRRLSEGDFDRARETLESAREIGARLDRRDDARERVREAERAVERRIEELGDRIDDLERLTRLGDADLDAPVEKLRDPVEAYNEAVREAFEAFQTGASAREFFEFVAAADAYPLVEYRQPPSELYEYVFEHPAGEEPLPTLLEYADYSASKLDHYVDDPSALRTHVAVHRTYLERLDAEPLTVAWPPAPAATLRYRLREREALVHRFADEETVSRLRTLRALTREAAFADLREAAVAREELDERERERLANGAVDDDLAEARAARERLREALEAE
jgi:hypothetical protein